MTAKVERGVAIHWYLDLHWLASERSVTQQVCEVSLSEVRLGAAGQKKIASFEISRGVVCHTTASERVNLG